MPSFCCLPLSVDTQPHALLMCARPPERRPVTCTGVEIHFCGGAPLIPYLGHEHQSSSHAAGVQQHLHKGCGDRFNFLMFFSGEYEQKWFILAVLPHCLALYLRTDCFLTAALFHFIQIAAFHPGRPSPRLLLDSDTSLQSLIRRFCFGAGV